MINTLIAIIASRDSTSPINQPWLEAISLAKAEKVQIVMHQSLESKIVIIFLSICLNIGYRCAKEIIETGCEKFKDF